MTAFSIDQQVSDLGIQAIAFVASGIAVPEKSSPGLDEIIETAERRW
ncbi:hypothetical protein [Nocardia salmonicida]